MRCQLAGYHAVTTAHQRHVIPAQDFRDLGRALLQRRVQCITQVGILARHRPGHRILQYRIVDGVQGHQTQAAALRVIPGHRTPGFGRIQRVGGDPFDQLAGMFFRRGGRVVEQVLHLTADAVLVQRLTRRRALEHAQAQLFQRRVVQRGRPQRQALTCDQHIRRAIDRARGQPLLEIAVEVHQYIAAARIDGATRQAALVIGAPLVFQAPAHGIGNHLRDLVLEAFAGLVGQRHVARVCAHAQDVRIWRRWRRGCRGRRGCRRSGGCRRRSGRRSGMRSASRR